MNSNGNYFDPIKEDHQSGSSRILEQVIWACEKLIESNPDKSSLGLELLHELENIQYHHPDLVIIRHFSNELEKKNKVKDTGNGSLLQWIEDYKSEWRHVNSRIARNFLEIIDLPEFRVLLHSHSGTLIEFGRELIKKDLPIKIYQTLSEPGGEGLVQAAELKNLGIDPIVINDDEIEKVIDDVNLVLFGADQISKNAWINKVGTLNISSHANKHGVQVWVLCDSRKIVNRVEKSREIFEEIGIDFATGVITEKVKI